MLRHLYVHVPFCARVCPYCAFHVHRGGPEEQRAFVLALRREWQLARAEFPLALETIYFGGGTPSLLSPELFGEIAGELPLARKGPEFTLEVNPATVTEAKAKAWRAAGVNRISLGAQSFDAPMLELLGRQHGPQDVAETCELLRAHGFDNINIDLMFALPGQDLAGWEKTLAAALACRPEHVSAYALTYEEDTPFFEKQGLWQLEEETEIAMFQRTREALTEAGIMPYEISNFARAGRESRHNLAYWRGADYLGLGPSACSTVGTVRWRNVSDTPAYVRRSADGVSLREEFETINPSTRTKERIMFGLRMREGVERGLFAGASGDELAHLTAHGLTRETDDRVYLTPRGQLVADSVAEKFI